MPINDVSIIAPNNQVGFFPSASWEILSADIGKVNLAAFSWVQAFWDSSYAGTQPTLLVENEDGTVNPILFAFSGEQKPFKGKVFSASGNDRYGKSQTATPINAASLTNSLAKVIVYGGFI